MQFITDLIGLTEEQLALILYGGFMLVSLGYALISVFRSRKLVASEDSEGQGFVPASLQTEGLSDWQIFWAALSPHLSELRERLTRAGIVLIVATIFSFMFTRILLDLITVRFLLHHSTHPMYVFGKWGLRAGMLGMLSGAILVYQKLVHQQDITNSGYLYIMIFLFLGAL